MDGLVAGRLGDDAPRSLVALIRLDPIFPNHFTLVSKLEGGRRTLRASGELAGLPGNGEALRGVRRPAH